MHMAQTHRALLINGYHGSLAEVVSDTTKHVLAVATVCAYTASKFQSDRIIAIRMFDVPVAVP
jgi:hypothetical protein